MTRSRNVYLRSIITQWRGHIFHITGPWWMSPMIIGGSLSQRPSYFIFIFAAWINCWTNSRVVDNWEATQSMSNRSGEMIGSRKVSTRSVNLEINRKSETTDYELFLVLPCGNRSHTRIISQEWQGINICQGGNRALAFHISVHERFQAK